MKPKKSLVLLSIGITLMTFITSGMGLFFKRGDGPFMFTTIHEEAIEIYGRGLYQFDSAFKAPVLRGTDAILLFIGVPLLVLAIILYRRGSLPGQLLLTGLLSCFLYNAVSVGFGAAYNELFLVYMLIFSYSLFAFVIAFSLTGQTLMKADISERLPYRGIAIFIMIAGLSPCVWLVDIIVSLIAGQVPQNVALYTTDVTTLLDVGIITPSCFIAAVMLLRRKPLGVLLSSTLLTLLTLIGLIVVAQSIMQYLDGIRLGGMAFGLYVVPFVSLSLIAVVFNYLIFRNIKII